MTQGGESGSPIFLPDAPTVIGLLHAGFDYTNITMGVPSYIVELALNECLKTLPFEFSGSPTLHQLMNEGDPDEQMQWDSFIMPKSPEDADENEDA